MRTRRKRSGNHAGAGDGDGVAEIYLIGGYAVSNHLTVHLHRHAAGSVIQTMTGALQKPSPSRGSYVNLGDDYKAITSKAG